MSEPQTVIEQTDRGQLVRDFRRLYKIELAELASRSDLSVPMISQFERGNRKLSGLAWKRVLVAIQQIVNENAEALGAEYKKISEEWMTRTFFPMLLTDDEAKQGLPEHLRNKPGQTWTAEDIDAALSHPQPLRIIEKRKQEIIAALEIWETIQKLTPQVDAEIEAEREAELLGNPQECLRQLKELKAAYRSLLDAVELQNKKLANLEAAGYVIVPKAVQDERDELRVENAKMLAALRILRGTG